MRMTTTAHALDLVEPLLLLATAVVAVPVTKRIGLGSVLGCILAGVVIGPSALGLFAEPGRVAGVAELGIVLLMFVIGLELDMDRLWAMRRDILGLSTAQIMLSAPLIALYPYLIAGRSIEASIVAGFGLALSSTAIVMQMLQEGRDTESPHGRMILSVLLMQDLAIVPLLALIALLSPQPAQDEAPFWLLLAQMLAAFAVVALIGRFVLDRVLGLLARIGPPELMTTAGLLTVLGAAALMQLVGLSMAAGAFLAGVLLARSTYRHELRADIEPFRGLLLGLFFLSVGMSVDLAVVAANWPALLFATMVLTLIKSGVMFALARLFGHARGSAVRGALLLAQGGEFGFVLYAAAAAAGVMQPDHASLLVALVTLSMILTPFIARLAPLVAEASRPQGREEELAAARGSVLIIGFGRVGQVVAQVLLRQGAALTILDVDVELIDAAARFEARVHYGDGTRPDVLRAAGAGEVRLVCVCTDREETTTRIVELLRTGFPGAALVVRSYDRRHALRLRAQAVVEVRETFESAMAMGGHALAALGLGGRESREILDFVRARDAALLEAQQRGDRSGLADRYRIQPVPLEDRAP
jgi:monovalent cation:proton antiporter-2 (CPA2) family protein